MDGNTARIVAMLDALHAGTAHHVFKSGLIGKATNAFDQILITVAIIGNQAAKFRQDVKAVAVVDLVKNRNNNVAKFQAEKSDRQVLERVVPQPGLSQAGRHFSKLKEIV